MVLKACEHCARADTNGRRSFIMRRPTANREHEARVSTSPNIELLCQFIDVPLNADQLECVAFF